MDVIRKRTKFRRLANHYASTFTSSEPIKHTPVNQSWSYPDVFGWYKATRT